MEGLIDLGSFLQLCGLLFLSMLLIVVRMKAEVDTKTYNFLMTLCRIESFVQRQPA